jgi:hypothetical protein
MTNLARLRLESAPQIDHAERTGSFRKADFAHAGSGHRPLMNPGNLFRFSVFKACLEIRDQAHPMTPGNGN